MLKILHTESSMGWGGQEIRIVCESLGMIRRGYRVMIAAPADSVIFRKAGEAGITVLPVVFRKTNPLSIFRTASLIDRERPDIINTHSSSDSWVATIAAKISRTRPSVIRTKHLSTQVGSSLSARMIYTILPDAIITTGEEIRNNMIKAGVPAEKIVSIPTGIDIDRFDPAKVHTIFCRQGFSVGMIGVLRSWKGHQFLIEAIPSILERIPDAIFYIVGDGPQRPHLDKIIAESPFKRRIVLTGHREDVPEIMASLDIIVHPSFANEGVPQTILQALAMAKPVIASDAGAIKEVVINGKTGILIEPRNAGQIAAKVIELHNSPALMASLGQEGSRLVKKSHSVELMLDKLAALYKKLRPNA
jgi:glycosyltransferase involved in cell wall biosynthesis